MENKQPKLYQNQKNSINYMRRKLGLDKMYLYRCVGNREKIERLPYKIVVDIAKIEGIEPNELYNNMIDYSEKKGD